MRRWPSKRLLRLAMLQVGNGQADRAVATFEAFEKKYPKSPDLPQARLEHARALYQGSHFDQAQAILEPMVADAQSATAADAADASRYLLALVYQGSKRPADALKMLDAMEPSASARMETEN